MSALRHYYRIEVSFGPEELFRALRETAGDTRLRGAGLDFEFDWLRRRVAISLSDAESIPLACELFLARAAKLGAPADALLPGRVEVVDGRHVQPFGVLLNPPEHLVEFIVQMLLDLGCTGLRIEHNGAGFSFPVASINKALSHEQLVEQFPMPPYARLTDEGRR